MWCYVKAVLLSMVYASVGGMMIGMALWVVVGIATMTGLMEALPPWAAVPAGVAGALVYIAFLLGFDIIRRLVLDRGVWERVVQSATLTGFEALEGALAAGGEVPSGVGEGLLDALDMGGGF
jgi:hypothetical protein